MINKQYFFDYPLADAHSIAFTALKFIYHGSEKGAFGYGATRTAGKRIDLDEVEAFWINLQHLSSPPLSDDFEYSLVFVSKKLSDHLWLGEKRTLSPDLKKLTRRVVLADQPSLTAKRYKTPFWVKFSRPVYLAKFEDNILNDHYIPHDYYKQFHRKYQGFLMRSENDYPLVRNLFEAYGLELTDRREMESTTPDALQVLAYSTRVE